MTARSRAADRPFPGRSWVTSGISLAALLLVPLFGTMAAAADDAPLEARRYRVLVSVAFDNDAALSADYRRAVRVDLERSIERGFGAMWQTAVVENNWLYPASKSGLGRLTLDELEPRVDRSKFDKAFFLTVDSQGARYKVSGRGWDAVTQTIGPVVSAETAHRGDVGGVAGELLVRLFQPVLAMERVEGNTIVLRVQASRYRPGDEAAVQVRPGDLIQPFFRYFDDQQVVRKIQFLPWTFLMAEEVDGGRVKCSLLSGLRSPLSGGRRRSVGVMAVRVRPHFASTRLKLVPRGNPSRPLIGYRVDAVQKLHVRDEPELEPVELVTDRGGYVEVPAPGDGKLVWLYVRSGELLLSRVPYLPGLVETDVMELPDDSIRLSAEGAAELLVNRLVDTVARRAVHIARARIAAREGKWDEAAEQEKRLDDLPGPAFFENELSLIRVSALNVAKSEKNRAAEAHVNRICGKVAGLIERYLAEDAVRSLKSDLEELRKLDAEDKRQLKK